MVHGLLLFQEYRPDIVEGGGVSIFQKCLNFNYFAIILQLFSNITFIRNVLNSKSSEFDPRGGVGNFQKVLKFKKF